MKIIAVDNYNRETVADHVVCENVAQSYVGEILGALNDNVQNWYYRAVADDYRLSKGMEDLV